MKSYEKPIAVVNDEISEGVYADSGDPATTTDCWTVEAVSVQDWNGSHHVYEIRCKHSTDVVHISTNTEVVLTFDQPLKDAYSEFTCDFSGKKATINRELHANAYNSGDTMTYKVWAQAADEGMTKALVCTNATIKCTHAVNVQGGYD